jgi:hypothetical protein
MVAYIWYSYIRSRNKKTPLTWPVKTQVEAPLQEGDIQMVQQTEKFSNLQSYFERAIDQIVIDVDFAEKSRGTIAIVPTSDGSDHYIVTVDENGDVPCAIDCTCNDHWYRKSYCKHMQVIDLYYQRIAAMFAHDEQEVVEPELTPDEIAAIAEEANMWKLAEYRRHVAENAYETLGTTKHVHCGGCHQICGEGKGDRCKPGFCFWNSFWTEAQRNAA